MLKIALAGAKGRMGQAIVKEIKTQPEMELVAEITRPVTEGKGHTLGGLATLKASFDVLIDFSNIDALNDHLNYCVKQHRNLVLGVTGLKEAHFLALKEAASKIAIVYSPNMSVGVNLAFHLIEMAAQVLKEEVETGEASVNIHEVHHQGKKDAPSGTALKMQSIIAAKLEDADAQDKIKISYERVGEVKGEHSLVFSLKGEKLKLIHEAEDRMIFARGALIAAKWLAKKTSGLYDMRDVLGLA
jgi:4-hydroxy-tetrahydrodipicolinate reductase